MKRTSLIMACAAIAAACGQQEDPLSGAGAAPGGEPIEFSGFVRRETRAVTATGPLDNSNITGQKALLWGYSTTLSETWPLFDRAQNPEVAPDWDNTARLAYTSPEGGGGGSWDVSRRAYWQAGRLYRFCAVVPSDADADFSEGVIRGIPAVQEVETGTDYLMAMTQVDADLREPGTRVQLNFRHLLSRLSFIADRESNYHGEWRDINVKALRLYLPAQGKTATFRVNTAFEKERKYDINYQGEIIPKTGRMELPEGFTVLPGLEMDQWGYPTSVHIPRTLEEVTAAGYGGYDRLTSARVPVPRYSYDGTPVEYPHLGGDLFVTPVDSMFVYMDVEYDYGDIEVTRSLAPLYLGTLNPGTHYTVKLRFTAPLFPINYSVGSVKGWEDVYLDKSLPADN